MSDDDNGANQEVRAPRPYRRVKPAYPEAAARAEVEATVDVLVDIDAHGEVGRVEIARWAGYGLDQSVLRHGKTDALLSRSTRWRRDSHARVAALQLPQAAGTKTLAVVAGWTHYPPAIRRRFCKLHRGIIRFDRAASVNPKSCFIFRKYSVGLSSTLTVSVWQRSGTSLSGWAKTNIRR